LIIADSFAYEFVLHFYDRLKVVDFVEMGKLAVLAFLSLFSWLYRKDSPTVIDADHLIQNYYFSLKDINHKDTDVKNDKPSPRDGSFHRRSAYNSAELLNKFMDYARSASAVKLDVNETKAEEFDSFSKPKEQYIIDDIAIPRWTEIKIDNKKTVVYAIQYKLNNKKYETKRSYSEFYKIFGKMVSLYPNYAFPAFPEKKNQI